MRHVNETRKNRPPQIGERFRSSAGVVEFRARANWDGGWHLNCKNCALYSDPCGFAECMLAYRNEADDKPTPCFGYYARIEDGEK